MAYLVFQPMCRYFKMVVGVGSGNYIYFLKSKGLSDENITPHVTPDCSLTPQLSYCSLTPQWKLFKAR